MHTTSPSLLERLRQTGDQQAWERFAELYTPLLTFWARHLKLQPQDAADLVQDVFALLVQKLPEFDYDQQKSFRAWLKTVLLNRWRDQRRRRNETPREADDLAPGGLVTPDGADALEEADYRQDLLRRALRVMQTDFQPATWKACWEYVVVGRPAAEVAADLGVNVGAVYVAKSRVLGRLRQELRGLVD